MRRPLLIFSALALAIAVVLFLVWPRERPPAPPPSGAPASVVPAAVVPPSSAPSLRPPRSPLADALGAATTPAVDEPAIVLTILEAYRRQLGAYPTGEDNGALLRLLTGANPARLAFVPPDHPRLSPRGELLDAWGSPFFFHVLARDRIEVRSPGPDRQLYTPDDLLAASHPPAPAAPPP